MLLRSRRPCTLQHGRVAFPSDTKTIRHIVGKKEASEDQLHRMGE